MKYFQTNRLWILLVSQILIMKTEILAYDTNVGFGCKKYIDTIDRFYNLGPLDDIKNKFKTIVDSSHRNGLEATIVINGCSSFKSDIPKCQNDLNSIGFIYGQTELGQAFCDPLSINVDMTEITKTKWTFNALQPDGKIILPKNQLLSSTELQDSNSGNLYGMVITGQNDNRIYSFEIKMFCEKQKDAILNKSATYDSTTNKYSIEFYNANACGAPNFGFFRNISNWLRYVYSSIFLIMGGFIAVIGIRHYKVSLSMLGMSFAATLTYFQLCLYDPAEHQDWWLYVNIGACLITAGLTGFFIVAFKTVSKIGSGMSIGFILTLMQYNLVFYRIDLSADGGNVTFYVLLGILIIGCGFASHWCGVYSLISAFAIFGSFTVVRMFAIMLDNYPDEQTIVDFIIGGKYDKMPQYFYIYLAVILLGTGISIFFQIRFIKKSQDDSEKESLHQSFTSLIPKDKQSGESGKLPDFSIKKKTLKSNKLSTDQDKMSDILNLDITDD